MIYAICSTKMRWLQDIQVAVLEYSGTSVLSYPVAVLLQGPVGFAHKFPGCSESMKFSLAL